MYVSIVQEKNSNPRPAEALTGSHKIVDTSNTAQKQTELRNLIANSHQTLQLKQLQSHINSTNQIFAPLQNTKVVQAKFYRKVEDTRAMPLTQVMKEVKNIYGNKTSPVLNALIKGRHDSTQRFYLSALLRDVAKLKQKRDRRIQKAKQISNFLRKKAKYGRGNVLIDIKNTKGKSVDKAGRIMRRMTQKDIHFPSKKFNMGSAAGIIQEGAGVCDLFASGFHFLAAQKGLPGVKIEQETEQVHHTFNMIKDPTRTYIPTLFADPWLAQVGEAHEMQGGLKPKFYKDAESHKQGYKEHDYTYTPKELTFNPNAPKESAQYLAPWSDVSRTQKQRLERVVGERTKAAEKDEQTKGVYDQAQLPWGSEVPEAPMSLEEVSDFESDGEELFNEEHLQVF